jgi:hypothetical protein
MAEIRQEQLVGVWRRSPMTWGFWWRTVLTLGLYVLLLWRRNQITVTTRRVSQRRGDILGGSETSVSLENVTDISVDVPPMGAIFDWGNIQVQSAGSTQAEISFEGLGRARQLRDVLFDLKDGIPDEAAKEKMKNAE